jgi:hypothetical protein
MGSLHIKSDVADTKVTGEMPTLYVGFEFETNLQDSDPLRRLARSKWGIENFQHTMGRMDGTQSITTTSGLNISIGGLTGNRYEKPGLVADVYMDGSVGMEIVTRPQLTDKLDIVKTQVYDELKAIGADFVANGKGGLHMTFSLDHHKCLSTFNRLWVKNVQQLCRFFYPDIINWRYTKTDTKTRPLGYRCLFNRDEVLGTRSSQHYSAISLRLGPSPEGNVVWGVEVRIPDGSNDWDYVTANVKFWRAFFELAWNCAKVGMLEFSQDVWNYNSAWAAEKTEEEIETSRHTGSNRSLLWTKGKGKNKLILSKLLSPFMKEPLPANHINTWVEWYNKQNNAGADTVTTQ